MNIDIGNIRKSLAGPDLPEGWTLGRVAAALALAALAVRAVFLLQWAGLPYSVSPCSDAWAYEARAMEILHGGLIRHTAFYQSPLYPYLLAGVYKAFGHHPAVMLWLQALAGSAACALAAWLGWTCFGPRAGLFAGAICAFYRPLIFQTAVLGKETFAVLAAAATAALALKAARGGRRRWFLLCGIAAGAGALLHSNALLLVPAALLWLWRREGRGAASSFAAREAAPLLLGAALAVAPASLHNWLASRDAVLINYNGGFTFYLGNNPYATGVGIYPPGFSTEPDLEETQPDGIAARESGRALKPSEISRFWFRRGLEFIASHPWRWAVLTAAKFWFFWTRYEIPDNYDLQFMEEHSGTLLRLPLAGFALAGCLGAAGLFLCRRREPSGLLLLLFLAYLASLLPFWMADRYRLPALALLLPLAGAALDRLLSAAAGAGRSGALRAFAPASPLMLLCLAHPPFNMRVAEASGWAQLVTVRAAAGDYRGSLEALKNTVALDPSQLEPDVIRSAAGSLAMLGRAEEGRRLCASGAAAWPGSAELAACAAAPVKAAARRK